MKKTTIAFIINPHSGTNSKKQLADVIPGYFSADSFELKIVYTEYAGHGNKLAAELAAAGYDVVVACGGDGTVNEIASALTGTGVAFGIVPLGSGNGLARHLGIPLDVDGALRVISEMFTFDMDCGVVNSHKFFCTCGTGFDAQISWDFSQQSTRGLLTYLKVIVADYWDYKPQTYEMTLQDGSVKKTSAFLITFANACLYGNDAFIAPNASVRDGLLDVSVITSLDLLSVPKFAYQLLTKGLDKNDNVEMFRVKSVKLVRPCAGPLHYDGEPGTDSENVEIKVMPAALKVVANKNRYNCQQSI